MAERSQNSGAGAGVKTVLGALGRFMRGLKDYNIMELLKILFALFIIALIIAFIRKPELFVDKVSYVFEMRQNRLEREHADGMYRRSVADQNIRWYLNELRDLTGADRAWVLEPHNGGSNSTTGMNFYYLNLTGDEPAEGYPHLNKDEFKDIPYSEYPLADYIDKEGYWWGPLSEMEKIDRKLYWRMKSQGMGDCAVVATHSMNLPICYVGLTWYEGHSMSDPKEVGREIRKYAIQIAIELAKTK